MSAYDVIVNLCKDKGIAVTALEKELGFGRGSIGKMKSGKKPSADRLQKIADYFGVTVDYLMTGTERTDDRPYYLDDDARDYAQFLFDNPEYRVLFDASRSVKKEDIGFVKDMIDRLTKS